MPSVPQRLVWLAFLGASMTTRRPFNSPPISVDYSGYNYEGRVIRSGPPSQLNLDENPEAKTEEIVDVCERLERTTPELGSARVTDSEMYVRARTAWW
jgi:hypothetical protein